jgi:hypothetical protein
MGVDGTEVSCPPGNLVSNWFVSTTCFQTLLGAAFPMQQANAQAACDLWCGASGGFQGLYPLGALAAVPGSGITCTATQGNDIRQETPGQCSTTSGPSAGAIAAVDCALGGRPCESMMTASDGTQYCAAMPVTQYPGVHGCFDPTTTTALAFCQQGFRFTSPPDGGASVADEFAYWDVGPVTLYASPTACAAADAANHP